MERVSASKTKKDLGKAAFQAAAILLGLMVLFPVIYCFFVSFMMPNRPPSSPRSGPWTTIGT